MGSADPPGAFHSRSEGAGRAPTARAHSCALEVAFRKLGSLPGSRLRTAGDGRAHLQRVGGDKWREETKPGREHRGRGQCDSRWDSRGASLWGERGAEAPPGESPACLASTPPRPPSLCDDVVGLVTLFMPRDGQLRRARRDGRKDRRSVVAGGGESPRRAQAHVDTAPLAGPRGTDEVTSEHAARGQGHACHVDFCVRGSLPRSAGWPSATAFSALWPHR